MTAGGRPWSMCRQLQVRSAPLRYSHPFTSHHPSLVPTGFHAAGAQTDRVGAGADPIGRLEEKLIQLGDASGQVGEALQVGEQQEARREWLLGRGGALWGVLFERVVSTQHDLRR